ncbi:MAG TPA: hypothetical protein VFA74_02685 [Terriglobales bacterium]|nr:hypothetical protein [Terriglobales bacterium]
MHRSVPSVVFVSEDNLVPHSLDRAEAAAPPKTTIKIKGGG